MNIENVVRDILSKVNNSDKGRPLQDATLEELEAAKGITRRRDMTRQEREAHDQRRATTRKKQWRKNKRRQEQKEAETNEVSPARKVAIEAFVLAPIVDLIDEIARMQTRRFNLVLGDVQGEVGIDTYMRALHNIARSKWDTDVLVKAADHLREVGVTDLYPKDHPEDAQAKVAAAKYLLAVFNNSARNALKHLYRNQPTLKSIEKLDTVLANTRELHDPDMARFKADGGAHLVGWNPPGPGQLDWNSLAMATAAAITERKLDPLAEVLLNDEYLRTDGAFMWTEHADKVWRACGLPMGAFNKLPKAKKAAAAKKAARNRFAWLPDMMEAAIRELQPDVWSTPRSQFESAEVAQVVSQERMAKQAAAALLKMLELT